MNKMNNQIDFAKLTLMDALDIAVLIEHEAAERYLEFAELIGDRYRGDAGDFFKEMAGYEVLHGESLAQRRKDLFGKTPRNITAEMIWNVEAPDENRPRAFMSVRQAYEIAIESEEKAYNFFDKALAHLTEKETRELFEELRDEEAEHKKMLVQKLLAIPQTEGPDLTDEDVDEPSEF
ncbi:MAG: ferritin family protein [Bdellovibrionaceae bacterium]|nr:ferritin family protein [Pseudobdellovibrionaceae bacterium]